MPSILEQIKAKIQTSVIDWDSDIKLVHDAKAHNDLRIKYLGKKGVVSGFYQFLAQLDQEEKQQAGQLINDFRSRVEAELQNQFIVINQNGLQQKMQAERLDITLPGRQRPAGSLHPITHTMCELERIFSSLGFTFEDGPEIETDYYNFTALNIPEHHPARAMQDTFYVNQRFEMNHQYLLRTQMSPVQIRFMDDVNNKPPFKMVAMGRVYRHDFDVTHTPMFHQMECLVVDKKEKVSFSHLKYILNLFLTEFFERDIVMRLRPAFFPFTEPSAEVDIGCVHCDQKGCRVCKQLGWLEVLGCGMVHPDVLKRVNIDTDIHQGFAFGVGLDRLAMLKYRIPDLRSLFENDVRLLKQF